MCRDGESIRAQFCFEPNTVIKVEVYETPIISLEGNLIGEDLLKQVTTTLDLNVIEDNGK